MCYVIVKGEERKCFECPFFKNFKDKDGLVNAYCMARTPREEASPKTADKCPIE